MKAHQSLIRAAILVMVVTLAGSAAPAAAQTRVTATDIETLQQELDDASYEVTRVGRTDRTRADQMRADMETLREEVIYLKVKLRKENTVSTREYNDVRDRIRELNRQATGRSTGRYDRDTTSGTGTTGTTGGVSSGTGTSSRYPTSSGRNTIPVDAELDVRLQTPLTSDSAQPEDRFEATTVVDLYEGDRVLVPAGSMLRGVVTSVDRASRTDRTGKLTLAFDQLTVNGRDYPIRATVTQAIESEGIKGEVARIGAGGAIGAIIGGVIGGTKGALIGVLVGAGGTVAATEGKDVHLDAGTILRIRFDQPVTLRR